MISKKRVTGSCSCDPICRSICAPLGRTIFVDVLTLLKIAIQSNLWIQNRLGVFLTRNNTTYLCIINVYSGFGLTIDVLKDFMLGNEARALKPFMQVYRVGSNTKVSKETLKKNFSANTRGRWNTILLIRSLDSNHRFAKRSDPWTTCPLRHVPPPPKKKHTKNGVQQPRDLFFFTSYWMNLMKKPIKNYKYFRKVREFILPFAFPFWLFNYYIYSFCGKKDILKAIF